eukprot:TRINITY_DN5371_c0_g1_i1.p1 TRINITY_DN5371_c0_g1~~TRINITY_DN5371_c0_g1_i1.p1  ORF type:complete len:460 (-),score=60.92 TRINITY_DN5371_c0_g1_i1:93-1472(-)
MNTTKPLLLSNKVVEKKVDLFRDGFIFCDPQYVDAVIRLTTNDPKSSDSGIEKLYRVHRIVLSYHSAYFQREFQLLSKNNDKHQVSIDNEGMQIYSMSLPDGISLEHFEIVLKYLYGTNIQIDGTNSFDILSAAKFLEVKSLKDLISNFIIRTISKDNVINVLKKAIKSGSSDIQDACIITLSKHFQVLESESPLDLSWLPFQLFYSFVSSDELAIDEEFLLYTKIKEYMSKNSLSEGRIQKLAENIRIPYISMQHLDQIIHEKLIGDDILTDALLHRVGLLEGKYFKDDLPVKLQERPRRGRLFEYSYDFDTNGVMYYLGTNGLKSEYKNPLFSGEVKCTTSSLEKGWSYYLLDRVNNAFWTSDIPSSWIAFDLCKNRCLIPTHYTLKHGGNSKIDCLRSWCLQGSNDPDQTSGWVTICRHTNDQSLNGPFATHTWKIPQTNFPYRYFRILQTGHNSG